MNRLIPALGAMLFSLPQVDSRAAVGFSVSPSLITNDFRGTVSLTVSNLLPGASVVVEQFADLNRNGVVDAGEPVVFHYVVTDGQMPMLNGIRQKLPADEDGSTNGHILMLIPCPPIQSWLFLASVKSIFRVSDPLGVFASVSQPFTVSQKVFPQGITGQFTAASGGSPITNTLVGLSSDTLAGTLVTETDTNGHYTLYCQPGTYAVVAVKSGVVGDENQVVNVVCGQMATNNVALTNAAFTISGRMIDTNGTGIPGILVTGESTNYLFSGAFTDTNGNYTVPANSNLWKLHPDRPGLAQVGFLPLQGHTNVPVTSANISNINFAVPKPTALIYGSIMDNYGNPVQGLAVAAVDNGILTREADGRGILSNATYALDVRGGTWLVLMDDNELATFGLAGFSTNVIVTDGVNQLVNVVVTRTNFPSLANPARLSSNSVRFFLNGLAAQNYLIQYSTNAGASNWSSLLVTNGGCAPVAILDAQATDSARYYRAQILP